MSSMRSLILAAGFALPCAASAAGFELASPDVPANGTMQMKQVFNGFGCSGQNVSPELTWKNAPAGTKSFAVTVYDPDAPTGSGWWHWLIFNLPPATTKLAANAGGSSGSGASLAPAGSVQSMTDFGAPGYGGPCPPQGDKPHRYVFTVYALKLDKLPVDAKASGAMVGYYLNQNALGKASFTATFGR